MFAEEDNTDPIWVFARRVDFTDIWWPQQKPRVKRQGKSAEWSAVTSIGAPYDVGYDFEILAATIKTAGMKVNDAYFEIGRRTDQWVGIKLPEETSNLGVITVKKIR